MDPLNRLLDMAMASQLSHAYRSGLGKKWESVHVYRVADNTMPSYVQYPTIGYTFAFSVSVDDKLYDRVVEALDDLCAWDNYRPSVG